MTALLRARDLSLTIGATPVLRSISFDLSAGRTLGLVGESGSGKSMTALSLIGLLPPGSSLSGSLTLNGEDLLAKDERALCSLRGRVISMAFQEPMTALNPLQTIGAQVAEVFLRHGNATRREAASRAAEALERVSLPPAQFPLSRYPFELSGGQRQRVVIAIAVALGPQILIADEPTTALDVTTEARILDLLRDLCVEDNIALLFVSHDLAAVARLSDRIAIMKDGEIVEAGETSQLFDNMQHPYSKALLAASTLAPARFGASGDATTRALADPKRRKDIPAGSGTPPILDVKNITRDYALARKGFFTTPGVFRAVDDVSFTLESGENLGVVGESGSGKSTLVRAVLGLEPLQAGNVRVNGAQFWPAEQREQRPLRSRIQAVFQDPYGSFNPRHRVRRIVAEPLDLMDGDIGTSEREKKVSECLVSVGLSPTDGDKYPHEFSGGQRQRIAIARALIVSPSVVVLDEATSALDVSVRTQILELLADLSKRLGVSYVFVSHDLDVVRSVTDRVMIMKSGRIVEQGRTASVFAEPQHPYTKSLIGAKPTLQEEIEKLKNSAKAQA